MSDTRYPVVILAGGPTPDPILEAGEPEKERAFIDIGGRPMLAWVLDAIRGCEKCGDILCVGNTERLIKEFGFEADKVIQDKGSMLKNFIAGMEYFRGHPIIMQSTCDIPLINTEILSDLIRQVDEIKAEVYYPIVNVKHFDEKFPGGKRTTQKLKEGTFTGGNVFFFNPDAVLKNRDRIEAVIRDRKSPAKLIKLFGFGFTLKFALKMLDINGLEKKATQILGATMRAVVTPHPEIGLDVDKPEDLDLVRKVMGHA